MKKGEEERTTTVKREIERGKSIKSEIENDIYYVQKKETLRGIKKG